MPLPEPECMLGYTTDQVERILGDRQAEFSKWFAGQTFGICDGRLYNYVTKGYEPSGCGPHGYTVYPNDFQRFMERRANLD